MGPILSSQVANSGAPFLHPFSYCLIIWLHVYASFRQNFLILPFFSIFINTLCAIFIHTDYIFENFAYCDG